MVVRKAAFGLFAVLLFIITISYPAFAAKRKKKGGGSGSNVIYVDPSQVFSVNVKAKVGKKQKTFSISCLDVVPGEVKTTDQGMIFTSYAKLIQKQKKKKKANPARLSLLKQLKKAGSTDCRRPDYLEFDRFAGRFGEREARTLFDRFAFGATPERIDQAVADGLDKTVAVLTAFIAEPALDEAERDLRCDGVLAGDPENEVCANDNEVYFPGVRYGLYNKFYYSTNPFLYKLWMFLHDERMAASSEATSYCDDWAFPRHVDMIMRAAVSGDFVTFMRDWNRDHLGHIRWLDGGSNRKGAPNENYAREFWELGTIGPTGLDGNPVYTDFDIVQSALAFSGWAINDFHYDDGTQYGYNKCSSAPFSEEHAWGGKVIFGGTPYETLVEDSDDVLEATFRHPRTAEHLAEDIMKEFISPFATAGSIRELAQIIRDNGYNLIPVFQKVMKSRAMFSSRNQKALIKHPVDLMFGFLRATGMPMSYRDIDHLLEHLGQQPTLPPTVFGWNPSRLAGEAYVLEWRNVALDFIQQDSDDLAAKGFSFNSRFLSNLPTARAASLEAIDRLARWLDVELNDAQRAHLDQFMNYDLERCYDTAQCGGQQYVLERNQFDPHPQADYYSGEAKLRGLIGLLLMTPIYRLK